MEFHISRAARDKYLFDQTLFAYDGNVIFANFTAVREFASKINNSPDANPNPEKSIKTSHLNAMGLIDEIFHHIFALYREQKSNTVLSSALSHLVSQFSLDALDQLLLTFVEEFPPSIVYAKEMTPLQYLTGSTGQVVNKELLLEELLMLWITNQNPALATYEKLFFSKSLMDNKNYTRVVESLIDFLNSQPKFGPQKQSIIQMLLSPSIVVPDSIIGQLEFIRENWADLLGDYLSRLLSGLDLIKEESKSGFFAPVKITIPVYDQSEFTSAGEKKMASEAFSRDSDWMPKLVLIAKNTYVWLDQLSRTYNRPIRRLDQIPDEELKKLARYGVTGLWLIGLWERSPASARIKQLCGNPDAISSAYSLFSYQIADDLGGESAYVLLKEKADQMGIRLASDMVPNHMGIDSDWVYHHPDRFLSLRESPYPSYSFNGENLSTNPAIRIQIEDHYYTKTDAAVVFKRVDQNSGEARFIYHGNDGTSMPWNDTAQLNYLNPEVREAVIQTILDVARKFPIIRFDAAMTLAKKHIQRLWFPPPGSGGAIPSRSENGISQTDFEQAIPTEFWREVVDRIAKEVPDTLLLAEAFWLMESYFVRTLGMHRVYNSAFMHMLRDEDNAGYRKLLINTLEFEPEIMKRFVNFMNNPDERTAVDQFGKGDKYFGICTLLVTLPGLPMLGHGQIEGFTEKYGMEFRKAYLHEHIDQDLVSRHEREIFPLLHQRELFAGVENFWMFDFQISADDVNQNVYAFSNRRGNQSALVVYNNNILETDGWIQTSVGKIQKTTKSKKIKQISLSTSLNLNPDRNSFVIFRDQISGLSFIRPASEFMERGLHVHLKGYEYHVFHDFQLVKANLDRDYAYLYDRIHENGISNIEDELKAMQLIPVIQPYKELVNPEYLGYLIDKYAKTGTSMDKVDKEAFSSKAVNLISGVNQLIHKSMDTKMESTRMLNSLNACFGLAKLENLIRGVENKKILEMQSFLDKKLAASKNWINLLAANYLTHIQQMADSDNHVEITSSVNEDWQLFKITIDTLRSIGYNEEEIRDDLDLIKLILTQQNWYSLSRKSTLLEIIKRWMSSSAIRTYLHVHSFEGTHWYNREAMDNFLWVMFTIAIVESQTGKASEISSMTETILNAYNIITTINKCAEKSEYQVEKFLSLCSNL